jgi:hypothetical protein
LSTQARVATGVGAIAVLVGLPVALVGPVVRAKVSAKAGARGMTVAVGRVRPGWGGIWLLDVEVRTRTGRVEGTLDAVRVPFGEKPVEVHGGRLALRGKPEELERELAAEGRAEGAGGRRLVVADGLRLNLAETDARGTTVAIWGAGGARDTAGDRLRADRVEVATHGARWMLRGLAVALGAKGPGRLRSVRVSEAELGIDVQSLRASPGAGGIQTGSTPLVAVPAGSSAPPVVAPAGLALALPTVAALVKEALPEGSGIDVNSARLLVTYRGEHLGFGPSRVSVRRADDSVTLEVSPSEGASPGTTPLALRGKLPLSGGTPSVELEGGPVSLAALGVRDGELGLKHTREATLEAHLRLELAGGGVHVAGSGALANVSFQRPEVSAREVRGLKLGFRANGDVALDGSRVKFSDSELWLGEVKLAGNLEVERDTAGTRVRAAGGIPLAACDAVIASIPAALLSEAPGIKLEGTFALTHAVSFDSAHPSALSLALHVDNGCHVTAAPEELSPERFRSVWSREVKGPDGQPMTLRTGPGASGWIRYDDLPRTMEIAVLVCEDGGFFRHRGFDFRAIEMALKDDIIAGRFVRGASTISMQLAKNLYLGKEKTLSRKVEEALLTMLLESKLSKNDLLEIYLNIVELGPGIYGIEQAADYYFNEGARELTLGQALYLASILPDPTRTHFEPDGRLSPRWGEYIKKLMRIARDVKRITDDELAAGLEEELAFRQGSGASPGVRRDGTPASIEDDDARFLDGPGTTP